MMNEIPILHIHRSGIDYILDIYCNSLLGADQNSPRTLRIKQKCYIPHLIHYIRSVLKECQTCQLHTLRTTV